MNSPLVPCCVVYCPAVTVCVALLRLGRELLVPCCVVYCPAVTVCTALLRLGREQLRPCVEELVAVYQTARQQQQQAVIDKFAKDKYLGVSQLDPPAAFVWD